jgi:hypothetical protein
VTVCIAAACRNGEYVVSATDGALSLGGEAMDMSLTKMYWFSDDKNEWQFMYAGEPSNVDLILENVRQVLPSDAEALTRERIQQTVKRAFKKYMSEWVADYVLAPYNMSMEEFKRNGKNTFGDELTAKLARDMNDAVGSFKDEMIVVGWGKTPISVMIYGVNGSGSWSGALTGLGTIGAGRDVALSTLLLYGITRRSALEDALYAVAAAKFSAERCDGVGQNTTICVSRKSRSKDSPKTPPYGFCTAEELNALRKVWEEHGKPRIPNEASATTMAIAQRLTGGIGSELMTRFIQTNIIANDEQRQWRDRMLKKYSELPGRDSPESLS